MTAYIKTFLYDDYIFNVGNEMSCPIKDWTVYIESDA